VQNLNNSNISGKNSFSPISVTYSQFVNALKAHATTPEAKAAAAALAALPDPSHGASWEIAVGEALILGLTNPDGVTDDTIILNSQYWTSSTLANNPMDAEGLIEHELSEGIMGRIGSLGIADTGYWAPMDLFRFTASGQRDFTGGKDGQLTYFSADGTNINTRLQYHNSVNSQGRFDGGDFADWDQVGTDSNAHDPFGPGGPGAGDPGTLSATDIQIMQALSWASPGGNPALPIGTSATLGWRIQASVIPDRDAAGLWSATRIHGGEIVFGRRVPGYHPQPVSRRLSRTRFRLSRLPLPLAARSGCRAG
jgi:hypothetical protein